MLQLLLYLLCFVYGNAFPPRSQENSGNGFDFDAYLAQFSPVKQTIRNHQSVSSNQDYRYIPSLKSRPDYIPPPVFRGHHPIPNIPRRAEKHRSWHSTYQDGNFLLPLTTQPNRNVKLSIKRSVFAHKRDSQRPTSASIFIHSKMEDLGDYEAPVILESTERKKISFHPKNEDYDIPEVVESKIKSFNIIPSSNKQGLTQSKKVPVKKSSAQDLFVENSVIKDFEVPVVVAAWDNEGITQKNTTNTKSKQIISNQGDLDVYEGEPTNVQSLRKVNSNMQSNKLSKLKPTLNILIESDTLLREFSTPINESPPPNNEEYKTGALDTYIMKSVDKKNALLEETLLDNYKDSKVKGSKGYETTGKPEIAQSTDKNEAATMKNKGKDKIDVIDYSTKKPDDDDYKYNDPATVEDTTVKDLPKNEMYKKPVKSNSTEEINEYTTDEYDYDELEKIVSDKEGYETPNTNNLKDSSNYEFDYDYLTDEYPDSDEPEMVPNSHESTIKTGTTTKYEENNEINKPASIEKDYKPSTKMSKVVTDSKKRTKREVTIDYEDYELPIVLDSIVGNGADQSGKELGKNKQFKSEKNYGTQVVKGPGVFKYETLLIEQSPDEEYELPVVVNTNADGTYSNSKAKIQSPEIQLQVSKDNYEKQIDKQSEKEVIYNMPIEQPELYNRNKREREYNMESVYPIMQDAHMRPIDQLSENEYDPYLHQNPGNYFKAHDPAPKNVINGNSETLNVPDNQIVLDSITIDRENPDGREIPFLEVLAVEDKLDSGRENGLQIMAINKENGEIDVINVGHENSNLLNENFDDSGSGDTIKERSIDSRGFHPLGSNTWSFMNHVQAQERRKFKKCLTPKNETGNCMPVQMCPVPNIGNTVEKLLKNVCIIDDVFIGICCPEFPVETVSVDWSQHDKPETETIIESEDSPKIKGCGKPSSKIGEKDSWPWMALLVSSSSERIFCGGAFINENYVLTAAHCTSRIPRNQILIRTSARDSQQNSSEFAVVEIKRHAQYNPRTMQNDIALLKLSRKVSLGKFRKLVCLPSSEDDYVNETSILLRWQDIAEKGASESLAVVSNQKCQDALGAKISSSILCTETRSDDAMCNGDSGAPLVIEKDGMFRIIGTLTWNRNDCDGNFPTVFTRTSSYLKWIQTHTK